MILVKTVQGKSVATYNGKPCRLVGIQSVALLLGCHPRTVRRRMARGAFPLPTSLGGTPVWPEQQIVDWVSQ